MDVFNDKIKPLFDSSGMTDKEIETALGLPRGVIYKWKSGKYKSYKDYLPQISKYFHISADYLMGIDTAKSPVEAEREKESARNFNVEGWTDLQKAAIQFVLSLPPEKLEVFLKMGRAAFEEKEHE